VLQCVVCVQHANIMQDNASGNCCATVQCIGLQRVAACCSVSCVSRMPKSGETTHRVIVVLQCVAACCSVLQRVGACCSVLKHVAVCCVCLECQNRARLRVG